MITYLISHYFLSMTRTLANKTCSKTTHFNMHRQPKSKPSSSLHVHCTYLLSDALQSKHIVLILATTAIIYNYLHQKDFLLSLSVSDKKNHYWQCQQATRNHTLQHSTKCPQKQMAKNLKKDFVWNPNYFLIILHNNNFQSIRFTWRFHYLNLK